MSESKKSPHHNSSLTLSTIHFFRASMLCLSSLISTFDIHPFPAVALSLSFLLFTQVKHDQEDSFLIHEGLQVEDDQIRLASEDMDEDIIEIASPEQRKGHDQLAEPALLQHGLELQDFLTDVSYEIITGEDRLIELDIAMGSIRHRLMKLQSFRLLRDLVLAFISPSFY
ncbi:uncharacterized protein LOC127247509 [Andrographis paniculata]|uniref:uncharacterized protein LOC127247509 n=1 Tax=Andrographis paniculata TaxID=175694 RepID=UPI0021E950A5|nr:uncharacterized protein LOC127247509 [Andrographis paniculata]